MKIIDVSPIVGSVENGKIYYVNIYIRGRPNRKKTWSTSLRFIPLSISSDISGTKYRNNRIIIFYVVR